MSELIQFAQRIKEKIKFAIMIFSVILECKENISKCKRPYVSQHAYVFNSYCCVEKFEDA